MQMFWKRVDKEQVFFLPLHSAEAYFKFIPFFLFLTPFHYLRWVQHISSLNCPLAYTSSVWFSLATAFPLVVFKTRHLRLWHLILFRLHQYELRKKEEKEAAEALKREEELREAKRQQHRLNFLLSQTELYSHFMQNKTGGSAPPDEEDVPDEEDPEEAQLKREALRAAQHAVSQQKMKTNAFDSEIVRLRQTSDSALPTDDSSSMDPSKIDLLHP